MKSLAHVMLFALFVGCSSNPANRESLKTFALKSWGSGAPRLLINLPATFGLKEHDGPDFTVSYFTDAISRDSFGIYIGHNPNRFNKSEEGAIKRPAFISNRPVEWYQWSEEGKPRSETVIKDFYGTNAPRDYAGLMLHIFTNAKTKAGMLTIERFSESVQLEERSK